MEQATAAASVAKSTQESASATEVEKPEEEKEPEEQPLSRTLFGAPTPEAATASAHAASSKAAKAAASDDSDGSDSDGARAREESARAHAQAVAAKAARKRDRALEKAQLSAPRSETAASKRARLTPPMLANAVMEVLETGGFDGKSTLGQMLDAVGDKLSVDVALRRRWSASLRTGGSGVSSPSTRREARRRSVGCEMQDGVVRRGGAWDAHVWEWAELCLQAARGKERRRSDGL